MEVGDGPTEVLRGGKGTRGRGGPVERRVDGEGVWSAGMACCRRVRAGGGSAHACQENRGGRAADGGVVWHSTGAGSNEFDSNSNCKRIRIIFKFVQTLTAPKRTFSSLKILK
jgi:hypothetical protein